MTDLQILNKLIKERFTDNHFKKMEIDSINPFYVTREEADALLEDVEKNKEALPGLEAIATLFQLNKREKGVLLMIMAPEIDIKYERIYAYLENDLSRKDPTLSLMASLLCETEEERREFICSLSSCSPLRIFHLINFIDLNDGTSLLRQHISIELSVKNFLMGHYSLDDRLEPFCHLISEETKEEDIPEAKKLKGIIEQGAEDKQRFAIHLYGNSNLKKQVFALEIASAFDYGVLTIDIQLALSFFDSINDLIVVLYREAILSGSLLYFDKFDAFFEHEQSTINVPLLFSGIEKFSWLTFFASNKEWKPLHFPKSHLFLSFPFTTPHYPDSIILWEKFMAEIDPKLATEVSSSLAQRFNFDENEMEEIIHILKSDQFSGKTINQKSVYKACKQKISTELEILAQHIDSSNKMDDIVLPQDQKDLLDAVIFHYKNQFNVFEKWGFKKYYQSQGMGILFTGSPGTGKTMAAAILANTLELDLYRIELSQVVSKYIGETEKNLSKIFEAAAGSGVILFFDEADAIFGKRTEVKDAHDRYANIEVSYLLQKIEEYDGLVILASNFRKNIDEAFVRRMRFIVEFPFPDELMREQIWRKVFPKEAPLDHNVKYTYLAKNFVLSGANIRNSALFAAFFASEQQSSIQMRHIAEGLKTELTKMGKSYKISDFSALLR